MFNYLGNLFFCTVPGLCLWVGNLTEIGQIEDLSCGFYDGRGKLTVGAGGLQLRLNAGYCRFHGCNLLAGFLIGAGKVEEHLCGAIDLLRYRAAQAVLRTWARRLLVGLR